MKILFIIVAVLRAVNAMSARPHTVSIAEFGAIGDGVTINTKAFQNAMFYLKSFSDKGGAELFIPAGKWVTGSFELISHLTLFLDEDAEILGSIKSNDWPVVEPLPSYGRGRELPGMRHRSLIYGQNLSDIIITGNNGTVDGQGSVWWDWFHKETLNYTRPHLIELMNSTELKISNLTFLNSPFWTIHPVYCSNVYIHNITIISPLDSPNTDGIDPDSSSNVLIENCHITTGDDLIAVKSGWDEYGIQYGKPSKNITIIGLTGQTRRSSGIAIGSEMSGGVSEVRVQDVHLRDSKNGIRIKTSPGRGGYVRNVYISNVVLDDVEVAVRFSGNYGEHPDEGYNQSALPTVERVTIRDLAGVNVSRAGVLYGVEGANFRDLCFVNMSIDASAERAWECADVEGYSDAVFPEVCQRLKEDAFDCYWGYSPFGTLVNARRTNRLFSS